MLLIEIGLGQRQRLVDPQPSAPEHDDQTVEAVAVSGETAWRITATISSTVGGSAGWRWPLLRGGLPARNPRMVAGERRRPAAPNSG